MLVYWNIVQFNFQRFLVYPLEIGAAFLRRAIDITFLVLFWNVVSQSSGGSISAVPLVAYFLIATSVDVFTQSARLTFAKYINYAVKNGTISNYFIRPLPEIPHLYASFLGSEGLSFCIAFVTLVVGIILAHVSSILTFLAFIGFLFVAIILSFAINLLVGLLSFYTPEATGLRFTVGHVIRVFSGLIIPLSFFPDTLKAIFLFTPFPSMVFGPTSVLAGQSSSFETWMSFVVAIIWIIILLPLSLWL
ncbi:MAG TPA: hypothetical protein VGE59_01720, partial [Patescibacteria group bacterium]